ncbi:MAG: methionine synthase [Phycisphaeraceae bacterium]|nr:methionine synthase [Phycisphaeraceae bacterium]
MKGFLDHLNEGVLIGDGAMGTTIHCHDLSCEHDYLGRENCSEILVRTRPELVAEIHETFLLAGSDAVETNTFGANRLVLSEFDLAGEARAINQDAAAIARAACDRHGSDEKPRFVLGSMGPGTRLITLGHTDWDELFESYREQALGLIDGGADALLIETAQDLLQVKCAVAAALAAVDASPRSRADVPIMVQVTIETTGTMLLGTEISAAAQALAGLPVASLGLNCATGPAEMAEHIRWLTAHWDRPVTVMPNAGLPSLVEGETVYPLEPDPFCAALLRFVEQGAQLVGGCCGTTPTHIAALAEAVGRRGRASTTRTAPRPGATSLYAVTEYRQDASILNVGERTNASGSRAFRKLLEDEDWDGCVSLARKQLREGSHVIDLNVDYAGRDNPRDMAELASRFARQVSAPIMLDSTQPATIEAGLKCLGGKCIINSANLEDGPEKFAMLCGLARRYAAAIVLGTIDEDKQQAMARTADRKLEIARRMYDLAVNEHGIAPTDILFDPLVLPISTGMDDDRRSGLETIEGVRRIADAMPDCQIIVGLSNVSFGLKPAARVVLNSVFFSELVDAGLTSAILHASKILPRTRIDPEHWNAALDLIYDRREETGGDPLQRFIERFADASGAQASGPELSDLPLEQRLQQHIIDGEKLDLEQTLDAALAKYTALEIINHHLLAGMKVVGDLFGAGQMQLPFVLQSAEVMKMAVSHLEPHMDRVDGADKGSIVLATVKGDVHDIGKNLVDIILTNNGYTVHNLGIKQPIAAIVEAWRAHRTHAIGLSGLLVKSVNVMRENLDELNDQGIDVPVLLGGAALSRSYCETEMRSAYRGRTYFGKDAFEGLRIMDLICSGASARLDEEIDERLERRSAAASARATDEPAASSPDAAPGVAVVVQARSDVATEVNVPSAPFLGTRVVTEIDLDEVYPMLNLVALFRGQWQFRKRGMTADAYQAQIDEHAVPILDDLKRQCRDEAILGPRVVYGYFPAASDGNDLVVYDVEEQDREVERFTFPRQEHRRRLCISDFFRPVGDPQRDVIAMTCVTVGSEVSRRARQLFSDDRYSDYLYLHGFGVECAEALAELWHQRVRRELGIAGDDRPTVRELFTQGYRGSRYSFGYPACPDMSDQEKLFRLLEPQRIGCALTENWQIDPEQSTSAIIVHHPEAKYFAMK